MPTIAKIYPVDADLPPADIVVACAQRLVEGSVGVLPTRCLYGLAANAKNPAAVERVFAIKRRGPEKPLLVLISDFDQLQALASDISPLAYKMVQRFWPGRVTFLFKARQNLPAGLIGPDSKIGVRWVHHPVTRALIAEAGVPLTGTSANLSGHPGCHRIDQLEKEIRSSVDFIIDAGRLMEGIGSSVVDATLPRPRMLREGVLSEEKFQRALEELQ